MRSYVGELENTRLLLLSSFSQHFLNRRSTTRATPATIRVAQETPCPPPLFLACALGVHTWKRGGTTGAAQRPRERHGPAGDGQAVLEEIRRAKSRFGLPEEARGVRGSEAGRDGFWLHRFFVSQGREHAVVDAARLEGNRRSRRAKTDRLEVPKRLTMLLRHTAGAKKVWRGVRVPSGAAEDRRPLHRERRTTKRARTRVLHRLKGLLAGCGMRMGVHGEVETQLEEVRQWDGAPRPAALRARLQRAWQKVQQRTAQRGSLEAERRVALRPSAERGLEQVRQ
jgi:transposase